MLTTSEKIETLKLMQKQFDAYHGKSYNGTSVGLCICYRMVSGLNSIDLSVAIPELYAKRDFDLHWWSDKSTKIYLKRTRAIHETIKELKKQLPEWWEDWMIEETQFDESGYPKKEIIRNFNIYKYSNKTIRS